MLDTQNFDTLEHFMIKNVIKLKGNVPITVACKYFYNNKIGSLLIESSTNDFACLTKSDIINIIGKGLDPGLVTVEEVASKPLITNSQTVSLENAMLLMAKKRIKRLFIINSRKTIVGVISSSDILRIAPGLLDISREELLIQSSEGLDENKSFSGICDDCKEFSESLTDVGGFAFCETCIKQHREEEDLETLNEDDEFED